MGHLNILEKSKQIFDDVVVGICVHPQKKDIPRDNTWIPKVEKIAKVMAWSGLTVDLIKLLREEGRDVTLVRGLRNGYDLNYEINQLRVMQDQLPDIKVVMIPCDSKYDYVSSSLIRDLSSFDPELSKKYELPS